MAPLALVSFCGGDQASSEALVLDVSRGAEESLPASMQPKMPSEALEGTANVAEEDVMAQPIVGGSPTADNLI